MSAPITEAHRKLVAAIIRDLSIDDGAQLIADSEAKACEQLRNEFALGQQNCDDAYDDLRAERDAARAEVKLWEAKCHDLIAPHYILDPCLRAQKFRDALAYHPVLT